MFKGLIDKVKSYFVKEEPILTDAEIRELIKEAFVKLGFESNDSFDSKFNDYFK
jgi:hypothetical protein